MKTLSFSYRVTSHGTTNALKSGLAKIEGSDFLDMIERVKDICDISVVTEVWDEGSANAEWIASSGFFMDYKQVSISISPFPLPNVPRSVRPDNGKTIHQ